MYMERKTKKKVIVPLCVTDSVVPVRHVYLLLHECNGDQHCRDNKELQSTY